MAREACATRCPRPRGAGRVTGLRVGENCVGRLSQTCKFGQLSNLAGRVTGLFVGVGRSRSDEVAVLPVLLWV